MDPGFVDNKPTLVQLMSRVGFLLLHWGGAERITGDRPAPELDKVRTMRNDLCHGMEAASADPRDDREPWIRCCARGGEVFYTWTDLEEAIRTLERFKGSRRS